MAAAQQWLNCNVMELVVVPTLCFQVFRMLRGALLQLTSAGRSGLDCPEFKEKVRNDYELQDDGAHDAAHLALFRNLFNFKLITA